MVTHLLSILAFSLAIGVQWTALGLTNSAVLVSSGGFDALAIHLTGNATSWAQGFGGTGADSGQAIKSDNTDSNIVVAGYFSGTITVGTNTLVSAGGSDAFVAKVTPAGSVIWAQSYGGAAADSVNCITVDSSDNIYVGGAFGSVNLLKYSSTGTFQFAALVGNTNVMIKSLAVDPSDSSATNLVSSGYVTGATVSFDGGSTILFPASSPSSFIAKLSRSNGSSPWAKLFSSTGGNQANAVAVDPSGTIVVAGNFSRSINLDPSATIRADGLGDWYFGKFRSNGTYLWANGFGGTNLDVATATVLCVDGSGNIYAGGKFSDYMDLGVGKMTASGNDLYLAKFAVNNTTPFVSTCVWSRSMLGTHNQSVFGMDVDSAGNVAITGIFDQLLNLGGGLLSCPAGATYGFIAQYTGATTGFQPTNYLWASVLRSTASCTGVGLSVGQDSSINAVGSFSGTATIPLYNTTTYYVSTNGNDANPGSLASPWATIGKAASVAAAGDTVNVGAGTFNEYVTNTASGNPGSPISFVGTRSGTNWVTIIDPSTPMTNGWVAAPEIGAGVYKHTGTFITRELTIANQRVAAVYDMGDISASLNQAYASPGITTGTQVLALATSATMTNLHGHVVTFWDGVEAMWGTVSTNTYLRLRNGSDPNGLAIRVSPNHPSLWTTDLVRPAINVNASYVTWRNFAVRNSFGQFYVQGSGNVIESNYLSAGYCRVRIFSGSGNTIQNNEATANYYGYATPGAWQFASGATNVIREQLYDVAKYLMGVDTSFDEGIDSLEAGANNLVAYNHVYGGIGTGVSAFSNLLSYSPTTNLVVCSNLISGHPSAGVLLSEGVASAKVFQNDIQDCNISVRFNHLDASLDSSRVAYVYRNRLWNPANAGEAFYFHLSSGSAATFFPALWIWNNSFSGGGGGLEISTFAETSGGLTNAHVLNNIFSGSTYIVNQSTAIMTNAFVLKDFAYNEVTPPPVTFPSTNHPAWWGAGNVTANAAEWSTTAIPTFTLSPLSKAVDAALNVTAPFVLNGTSYAALPGPSPVMSGSAFDIGVVEMRFPPPVTHLKVAHLQWKH